MQVKPCLDKSQISLDLKTGVSLQRLSQSQLYGPFPAKYKLTTGFNNVRTYSISNCYNAGDQIPLKNGAKPKSHKSRNI